MNEPFEVETVPILCRICKTPVAVELPAEGSFFREPLERLARAPLGVVHNECYDQQTATLEAAAILERENRRLTSWKTLCPPEFQKSLRWKDTKATRANLNKVLNWTYGERGLLVWGDNGLCKTRFMWRLLEREWNAGRTMAAHMHGQWRQMVTTLTFGDQGRALSFIESLAKTEILFIDDLGKGRATPASEEAFFDLLDSRMRFCRPTLFTSNLNAESLDRHFSTEFAGSIQRRIIDRCDVVEFL